MSHRLRSVVQLQPHLWFADCECLTMALAGTEGEVLTTIATHLDVTAAQVVEESKSRHPSQWRKP